MVDHLRVAARGSRMAVVQAEAVVEALYRVVNAEVVKVTTSGDRKQGTALASQSDKRDWIHDLELSIVEKENDLAVHCAKDVPAIISPDTILIPVLKRGSPWDIFIGRFDQTLDRRIRFSEVPQNGIVGTASLRRKSQLLLMRPDLSVVEHRGNATTRIDKLDLSDSLAGIVLAQAGVDRLGYEEIPRDPFPFPAFVPAVNQGILVAQIRRDREDLHTLLINIQNKKTTWEFNAERSCIERLQGDCNSAIGVYASSDEGSGTITLLARILYPNGSGFIEHIESGNYSDSIELGNRVADALFDKGAKKILEACAARG